MMNNINKCVNGSSLGILSTNNSFGFGYRYESHNDSDTFFIKKFENDLCNNLIVDFKKFISTEKLQRVNRISVSVGPGNFNASRLVVVLARTISQQINCPLVSFSSFELMSKRIAINNNVFKENKSFWIYKELKRKGFIAGKYEVCFMNENNGEPTIREKVIPKLFKNLNSKKPHFQASFDDKKDLKELLNLSDKNLDLLNSRSWETVLPLYPVSPIN